MILVSNDEVYTGSPAQILEQLGVRAWWLVADFRASDPLPRRGTFRVACDRCGRAHGAAAQHGRTDVPATRDRTTLMAIGREGRVPFSGVEAARLGAACHFCGAEPPLPPEDR